MTLRCNIATLFGCYQFLTSSPRAKAWLKKQLIQLNLYEARVREVEDVGERLKKKRDTIQHTVDEEERQHGRRIHVEVKEWIESVDKLILVYKDFHEDEKCHNCAVFDFFESGYLPKPGIRYHRSRKAHDITKQANELLQNAKFDILSYWSGPPSMAAFFSNLGYENYTSRNDTVKKITDEFQKPGVRMIGLHGLSGVGKTSLVKEVVKKALKDKMFEVVTMASVTKNPDVRKIQGQIVDMLGVVLEEESDIARAARIHQILNNENKSTLIILDDLWEEVNFNLLGIPSELEKDDGVTNFKGKSLDVDSSKNVTEGKYPGVYGSANSKTGTLIGADGSKNVTKGKSLGAPDSVKSVKKRDILGGGLKNANEGKSPVDASDRVKTEKTVPQYKGCKILMISEIKQVLLSQMEGKEEYIFPVEVLKEKEGEMLFKKKAGIDGKNSEFDKLAAQIAKKCKGLPMTIVTTARALKNKSLSHTFLLCARMGHDALIMDLVKYCIGFGFLRGINTVRQTRDKVYTLVAKLKESGLLSDSYSSDHFTMPDTVRTAALSIAYKENHLFTLTKGKVDDWPDNLESYAAISLHHCDFIEEFPGRINYPRLRVLQIVNNNQRPKIPKNFFEGVKELRVLILTGIHLHLIDSSISCLNKLRMLCLEQCCMPDEELSIIGELKRLRILSFSGSDIKSLPDKLNELKMLQIFDISNCSQLKRIPYGVISSLVSLEELYMRNTLIQWEDEEQTRQSKIALLSDLKHLNQLTTLDIQIPNVSYLPRNLFFDKLYSYKIVIGDLSSILETDFKMPEKYETLKFLAVQLKNGSDIHSLKGIKMLFEGVENLFLELNTVHEKHISVHEAHNIVHDLFYRLNLKGFPYLKHLWIVNNSTIQSLIHPKDRQHPEKAFPKLESLCLYNLKMNELCSCKLSEPSFGKLKVIKINLCGELKNVFSISVVRLLKVLETIEVSECNSLKEIIDVGLQSNPEKIELLTLPELRYLKLQSLSEFIGFDAIPPIEGEKTKLFHEKVGVSKLERLELSSIQIDVIWSVDHSSKGLSFERLTRLDVNGCWKLTYLMSSTMAKSMVNLQSLYVSECDKMRSIFLPERDTEKDIMGSIFPKLKNMKLGSMKNTLIIEECGKLENVMEGIFGSLCNLRVANCRSMQAIFNIREQVWDVANNLQDVYLETLPKLKVVWKINIEDRIGIPKFNKLKKMWAQDCDSLEYIFPFSVARSLVNLESLVVCDCYGLSEIVAEREATNMDRARFNFPKLSSIKFSELPKLTSFYPTAYDLSCPLNELSIELCNNLEPFNKATDHAQRNPVHVFFPEEVINNLKSMQIESWHAKSPSSYMGKRKNRRDNLEELSLSRLMDTEILYSFLHRNPNLKSLSLSNCFFEKIVPLKEDTEIENLGVVPNLKSFKLIDLPNLEEIGFEPDIILERLEFLILQNCPCMITIAPFSVTFTRLTNLEVVNCDGLQSLMSASTEKSLVQLNSMKVVKCESLMEIVRKDGENSDKVVFQQLKALELVSLKNLKSFCVSDCDFEFPSLEKFVVSACYNMDKFSERVSSSPILQNIHVVHGKENKRFCWEGGINATIKKIFEEMKFFEGVEEMSLSEHQELQETWQRGAGLQKHNRWFYSLKILKLENCVIQSCAIPSNILPYLRSLEELQMNAEEGTGTTFHLQKLTLQQLPRLTDVWERNSKGTQSYQNLKVVNCKECENLQTVFPLTLAKNLKKLDELEILFCYKLHEIVRKEEDTAAVFVFPCLTTLHLGYLPELIYFYPQPFTLDFPVLNKLIVWNCPELELFGSANRQSIFFDLKDICNLEVLILDWELTLVLRKKLGEPMDNLKYLHYIRLYFDADENKTPDLPIQILQKMPNLTNMTIQYCSCLELFQTQIPEIVEKSVLTDLKTLQLNKVSKLHSIGSEDSPWLNLICDTVDKECSDHLELQADPRCKIGLQNKWMANLETLKLQNCTLSYAIPSSILALLKNLKELEVRESDKVKAIFDMNDDTKITATESQLKILTLNGLGELTHVWEKDTHRILIFRNLQEVAVSYCAKLQTLFPAFLAKSLKELKKLQIDSCENLQDFVENEETAFVTEKFVFPKLEDLQLNDLPRVTCPKTFTMEFPSLNFLYVRNCDELEIHKLLVDECPHFTTLGVHSTSTVSFSCLKEVHIDKCPNLKYLFTSSAAKMLVNLEEISVRECESVTEIVAKEGDATSESIKFERLHAIYLLSLTSLVCFYSGSDTLQLSSLKTVTIWSCPNMKLFSQRIESLMEITLSMDEEAEDLPPPQDLNTSIKGISQRKEFFEAVDKECFSDNLELQEDPHCKFGLQNEWLGDLVTLKLQNCTLPCALPSAILGLLKSLKELEVRDSATVEVLFYMNDTEITEIASQLKILTLKGLSSMTHVWEKKKNGVLIFPNLQRVDVSNCENLQSLFPASLAKNLKSLKGLEIKSCAEFQEVVEKEEDAEAKFVLPCLENLNLSYLPQLTCFYPQTFTLECPALNKLSVLGCEKLSRLRSEKFTGVFKYINNMFLLLDTDQSEIPMVVNEIIFLSQNPKIGEDGMLLQLRTLILIQVSAIQSIQSENSSWLNTICEKVHELCVIECPHVETIGVHSTSTMSFSFLKNLHAYECSQLQYLFTSSVAKKLVNLEEIRPKGEGENKYENEIIFMKLESLSLTSLDKFESFHTGSSTLNFPSLRKVWVEKCFSTKVFRLRDKVPPKFTVVIDEFRCVGDKKPLIMQHFEEEAS
ncbi:hypothetical protein PHAVU_010G091200 [Phaseolus vulgaris]|uniref:AAA+ ATPase domain-containing protein n=1 Tax=Phaseolus vulgaris TaxID=3885 RepID=V7AN47_PHAVU|nr:hypothetical protein PHAVU_010G091200g [Phaseolus vulgaris]ESW06964.1 hypothetical protein PHAVU_010G091200g [Phaseolus vulgaris]